MIHALLPGPLYLVLGLVALTVVAFRRRQQPIGRWRWVLVALVVWSWIFSTPGIANAWLAALEHRYPRVTNLPTSPSLPPSTPTASPPAGGGHAALIVALSSGFAHPRSNAAFEDDIVLDEPSWRRTFAAIDLWRHVGGQILFVGGPASDGRDSAAGLMAAIARSAGVPSSAILVEGQSTNTYQNLEYSRALIAAHAGDAWLVTSAVHMSRAEAVAARLGLQLRPYPCDYHAKRMKHWYAWIPDFGGPALYGEVLHEVLGLFWYRHKGYASP